MYNEAPTTGSCSEASSQYPQLRMLCTQQSCHRDFAKYHIARRRIVKRKCQLAEGSFSRSLLQVLLAGAFSEYCETSRSPVCQLQYPASAQARDGGRVLSAHNMQTAAMCPAVSTLLNGTHATQLFIDGDFFQTRTLPLPLFLFRTVPNFDSKSVLGKQVHAWIMCIKGAEMSMICYQVILKFQDEMQFKTLF